MRKIWKTVHHKAKQFLFSIALLVGICGFWATPRTYAQNTTDNKETVAQKENHLDIAKLIFGHVKDAYEWHVFSIGHFNAVVHLPVLLYSPTKGFSAFMSSKFDNEKTPGHYEGYHIEGGNTIVADDGSKVYDFSLTKSVMAMFFAVILMLWIFISASNKYKKRGTNKAPKGMQNAVEVCVAFVRDDIAKPALGVHYKRFMPLLLSLFFFVWITSMLGLIPGGANLTGNIAVTCLLACVSFAVMLFTSKKHFWSHMFNPPGMPFFVKVILIIIEPISLLIKPTALMIRLFANMLAGHIVLICFVLLIFIFADLNVFVGGGFSIISVALSAFSMLIELLVAAIQAYIFAFLTAIFISQMIEEHSHKTGERNFGFTDSESDIEL